MKRDLEQLTNELFKQRLALAMVNTDLDILEDEFEMYNQGIVKKEVLLSDVRQTFTRIFERVVNLRLKI